MELISYAVGFRLGEFGYICYQHVRALQTGGVWWGAVLNQLGMCLGVSWCLLEREIVKMLLCMMWRSRKPTHLLEYIHSVSLTFAYVNKY